MPRSTRGYSYSLKSPAVSKPGSTVTLISLYADQVRDCLTRVLGIDKLLDNVALNFLLHTWDPPA